MTKDHRERLRLILIGVCIGAMLSLATTSSLMSAGNGTQTAFGWLTLGLLVLVGVAVTVTSVRRSD